MNLNNRKMTGLFLFVAMLMTGSLFISNAASQQPRASISRAYLHSYSLPSTGLAIEGYCPVSYFTEGKAIQGDPAFTSSHNGVDYQLASAEAKRLFDREPEKYIPAYGGWCAFGMAIKDKFPVDPTNFKIVDGRLMLFLRNKNIDALEKWNEGDEAKLVKKAEAFWEKIS